MVQVVPGVVGDRDTSRCFVLHRPFALRLGRPYGVRSITWASVYGSWVAFAVLQFLLLQGRSLPLTEFLLPVLAESVARFTALMGVGVVLGLSGRGALLTLPVLAFVLTSGAMEWVWFGTFSPTPVGLGWNDRTIGSLVDVSLTLAPGLMAQRRGSRRRRWLNAHEIMAIALVAFGGALIVWIHAATTGRQVLPSSNLYAAVFLVGVLIATDRPWWPWLGMVFPFLITLSPAVWLQGPGWISVQVSLLIAVALLAGTWQRLAGWFAKAQDPPLGMLLVLNLLNLADASLTSLAIGAGQALEANPLLRNGGLGIKIIGVFVASGLLYRMRPRLLLWPAVAYVAVLGYHLAGFVLRLT